MQPGQDDPELAGLDGTVGGMAYTSDLTDEQWELLEPVFNAPLDRRPASHSMRCPITVR